MTRILSNLSFFILIFSVACGGGNGDGEGGPDEGFTDCGNFPDQQPKTCNPGQYCADEIFSECSLGCLGNYNCETGSVCRKAAGEVVGTCDGAQPVPDGGTTSDDQLERCLDACSTLTSCGAIDVGDGAQCTSDCNGLSEGQQKAVADCVGDWDCSGNIPACLGFECGPAYSCPLGQDCVGSSCL